MSDFVFEHYFQFSLVTTCVAFFVMAVGLLFTVSEQKILKTSKAVATFLVLVALGMSANIKHVDLIGVSYAALSLVLAYLVIRRLENHFAYLLFIPCVLTIIVIMFNLVHSDRGLEYFGRWSAAL